MADRQEIELVIEPRSRDLGGFEVGRVLPVAGRRTVGPFIFFDEMGPAAFAPGRGIDVRPHPHIGLATVTYLFEGEIHHRDSLGYHQPIHPGDVNWMTAGRGIVHSERTGPEERARAGRLHGIQSWVALPKAAEETEPAFHHHPGDSLPLVERDGVRMRLIAGAAYGARSPVAVFSDMFYLDAAVPGGAALDLSDEYAERAVYIVSGTIEVAGESHGRGRMLVFAPEVQVTVRAVEPARLMLLGGAAMDGPRHIWWNFVSSSKDRIEQAKAEWKAGGFPPVPGETEFIPLPEE
jgi:redox-sensitive bicupin YhaK (pirin superfamily)